MVYGSVVFLNFNGNIFTRLFVNIRENFVYLFIFQSRHFVFYISFRFIFKIVVFTIFNLFFE